MDKLLELFEIYHCHLRRGTQSTANFLEENFSTYLEDVKHSISAEDNPLVGGEMCKMVEAYIDEITDNASKIIEVLRLYEKGKIVEASNKAFEVFSIMKPQLLQCYSGVSYDAENYYRIRAITNDGFTPERKELFHIPSSKNYLIGSERYSMPGYPCLYLASQAELAWYECGQPKKFAIAKFSIPSEKENYLKFIDFSEKLKPLKQSFLCWFHNEKDKSNVRRYLLKHIYTYPLRAACSVMVEKQGAKFVEEYIVPQLLLQWVRKDEDFDGIRYESCSNIDDVRLLGGHNIVLITKCFDDEGYDIKLRDCIKVGAPKIYEPSTLKCDKRLINLLHGNELSSEPFLWGMESISNDFQKI